MHDSTRRLIQRTTAPAIGRLRAEVEALNVNDKQLLLDYLDAVFTRTKAYFSTVKNTDLNRVLNETQYQPLTITFVHMPPTRC